MKNLDLPARIKHGLGRKREASARLKARFVLKLLGLKLQQQTELNYLNVESTSARIINVSNVSKGFELSFHDSKTGTGFQHTFSSRFLITASDVIVNSEKSFIFTADREFLSESSEWPSEQVLIVNRVPRRDPVNVIDSAKLGLANSGYYHWLTEDLPSFLNNESRLPVIEYSGSSRRNREIYDLLSVQTLLVPEWVKVQNLSFTTRGKDIGYLHPKNLEQLRRFRSNWVKTPSMESKKLYISRSKSRRSLPNESNLENFLQEHDYEIIYAEDFSFLEQLQLFSQAASIIGPHGAGLTNAIWADKTRILEIDSAERTNRCFEWQSHVCGHEYTRFSLRGSDLGELISFLRGWLR